MSGLLLNSVSRFAAQGAFCQSLRCFFPRCAKDRNLQESVAEITPLMAVAPIPHGRELRKVTGCIRSWRYMARAARNARCRLRREAEKCLEVWLDVAKIRDQQNAPLCRPVQTARGNGKKGFASMPMSRRDVLLAAVIANAIGTGAMRSA